MNAVNQVPQLEDLCRKMARQREEIHKKEQAIDAQTTALAALANSHKTRKS